ncbi:MAG TPA: hypothetical protein VHE35_15535 [Kofleriaceae bacterium]|nr:hypothetical protein [Kofleriaceae bacterium]
MSRPGLALLFALAAAAAGCHATRGPVSAAGPGAGGTAAVSPRAVLDAYLRATFSRHHAQAWTYLTAADQRRVPRDAYVRAQRDLDRLRAQVDALGRPRRSLGAVTVEDDRARATVTITTGLGRDRLEFVLRRARGVWRVDYAASWRSLD